MTKNIVTIIAAIFISLLSTTGRAQVQVTRQKLWRCSFDLGTHRKILRFAGFQHTVNEAQEAELSKKSRPGSDQCPEHFSWEEVPIGQESVIQGTIAAEPVPYILAKPVTIGGKKIKVETRTIEQIYEETKRFMPEFGGDCRAFRKKFGGKHPAIWDQMILEAYIDLYPGYLDMPNEVRLAKLLEDISVSRARFKPESDYCPYSTGRSDSGKLLAVGLTQLAYSSIVQFCPGEDFSNPYTHIWCGVAEALHKSNLAKGKAINAQIAYVAGSGKLQKYQAAAGSTDPEVVMAWLAKGGKFPGQTGKGQPGKDYSDIAVYVNRNIEELPRLFMQNREWFEALLQMPRFKFLTK